MVIVFGSSHHNTLGVIRALGEKGISSYLIIVSLEKSFVSKSKYLKDVVYVSTEKAGVEILKKNFKNIFSKPILICATDSISSEVDKNYDELSQMFYVPNIRGGQGAITHFMGKDIQSDFAQSICLNVPKSINAVYRECDVSDLKFPIITKPIKSILGKKNDIYICQNEKELNRILKIHPDEKFQIQEYIEKDFEYQIIGCSLENGEKVILPGVSKIIRCPPNTNTGFLEMLPINAFSFDVGKIYEFMKKLGYSGLFSLEFLRGKDGVDYFMEINMRNDGNAYAVTAAGVNLPYLWCMWHQNKVAFEKENTKIDKSVIVMPELNDFRNVISRKISIWTWLRDLKRTDAFLLYNAMDKAPFFYNVLYRFI